MFMEGGVENRRHMTNMTDEEQRLERRPGCERWKWQRRDRTRHTIDMQMRDSTERRDHSLSDRQDGVAKQVLG